MDIWCVNSDDACVVGLCYRDRASRNLSFAMNTYMTFTVYGENAQEALDESVELIQTMESRWAVTDDESEIYRGNHSDGRPISVSEETAALISFALDMAEKQRAHWIQPSIPF